MEFPSLHQQSPFHFPFPYPFSFPHHYSMPENYVHWRQTPESHTYSADLPGVRKEEIRVEVEDSRYLIIRTEETCYNESGQSPMSFMRKFRLPGNVNIDEISANYENGVLTVIVPRNITRREFFIDPADIPERLDVLAKAA